MQRGYDFGSVCLFMDLLAIELQNLWTEFDEILGNIGNGMRNS